MNEPQEESSMLEAGEALGAEFTPEAIGVAFATMVSPNGEIINVTARGSSLVAAINELLSGVQYAKNLLGWKLVQSQANSSQAAVNNPTIKQPPPAKAQQRAARETEVQQKGGGSLKADTITVTVNQKSGKPQLVFSLAGQHQLTSVIFDPSKTLAMLSETGEVWTASDLTPGNMRTGDYSVYWVYSQNGQYKNVRYVV